jgi:bifunctional DNA-binding transcriptional regulator/antitoxin component of YhaV-PrlF toxin-antitoxin module
LARSAGEPPGAESPLSSSSALRRLRDLALAVPAEARWRHWVVAVDAAGRVALPESARRVAGPDGRVHCLARDRALVLRVAGNGPWRRFDDRGRLLLPEWLRRLTGVRGMVLVAAAMPDVRTVVVAPAVVLDVLVEDLVGMVV